MNSVADIWKIVLSRLSQDLSETTISTWFDEVEAVSIKDRTLYLHCPNDFKRSTIESMFSDRIKDSLRDIYSADFDVKLLSTAESTALFEPEVKKSTALLDSGEFTFDTFVVGESNKMAYAAARAVADGVGHYNPLFIYGDSGLGKTHLIYAIAHQIRTTRPSAKIIYIKGDDFINEFIELVRAGRGSEFRAKYRDADLLLVDDVQFVAGKEQVQNEFFHTFNTLYEAGRQIVLTSDRPPSDMHLLDDRLRTRFEWGLLVDVQPPDFETRLAIVKNKAAQWGTVIDDDIAKYIAENVTSNVRQLLEQRRRLQRILKISADGDIADIVIAHAQRAQKVHTGAVADLRVGDKGHALVDALLVFVHCHHLMAQLVELHGKMPPEAAQSDQ